MNSQDWIDVLMKNMQNEHVLVRQPEIQTLDPIPSLVLDAEDWGNAARIANTFGCRWAGVWGDAIDDRIILRACLVYQGNYLILRTHVPLTQPILPSHTPYYCAADRPERHLQDMFGIAFSDHPDPRRWSRHLAWPADRYPLRNDFPVSGLTPRRTRADSGYAFVPIQGNGVSEIPVGPVHAGIIEPGHFRFHVMGEEVLQLEERLGYVHKGIEKIAIGRDAHALARLASRISGDSCIAHCWTACMALENAYQIEVPARALIIRATLAERERLANHLGDIGAICNDVGFSFMHMQCSRLREDCLRTNHRLFGHRLLMDCIIPGGVNVDLSDEAITTLSRQHDCIEQAFYGLVDILNDYPSLEDRMAGTGILEVDAARQLGVIGYVGKASAQDQDVRRDYRYPPYDQLEMSSPCLSTGDVSARLQVRALEIQQSFSLLRQLLKRLPHGDIRNPWRPNNMAAEGIGIVEGWRGEIISYVRTGEDGKIARFFSRDPSWFSWPALERLIHGNIVADFPVCNKSVNGSYSGHDL